MDRWAVESVRSVRAFEGNSKQDELTRCALDFAYDSLPAPPATPDAPLAATGAACSRAPGDGVDRISSLPDQILRNVVSRLPAADAARTAALATRWRGLWRAVPLVFVDAHLLPTESRADPLWRPGLEASLGLTNAASAALAAHPGPFRCVHLTCSYMDTNREEIKRWMQLLAAKGVQQLAFINRPWPLDIPLPATVFSCASLTRLHIGAWKFPDTAALPRAAAFPHLQELYLSLIAMKDRDLAFLLDRCPVLEVLTVIASQTDVRMCVVSRSLRCLQLVATSLGDIAVAEAPRLERLILFGTLHRRIGENKYSRIKIGNAPNLRMLGYWDQGQHELQIGNTIVQAGSKVSPSTIVPGVQILALDIQFEVRNEVKMLPFFLQCFPNIETLHINSMEAFTPTGKVNAKFWHEAGSVECVEQHIKKLAIHGFRGTKSELAFLKFIAERAQVLEKMVLILSPKCFPSVQVLKTKLNPHATAQWASTDFKVILFKSSESDGGAVPFNPRISADFSCDGPFDLLMVEANLSMGAVFLQYPKIN
ncbi:hypothetical protein QOZ80_1AG0004360 [Eleusine coracana subsp. coracana]|nr:hypothetical protein QOZ80_1AG0004360 [Eleusine coracana subsp. coracana]